MRSEAATPPGSRSARTGTPSSSSARASAAASVVLPEPSRPSMLTRRPRGTAATISTMPVGMTADLDRVRARVAAGVHPDFTWVAPSGVHEMRVEDVAEPVVSAATRTPFEARRRVFVLERADTLNDQAANRLLKTLEEPAAHVHLILVTDRLAEVLPTIVSRCQLVRFDPLPVAEIARRLAAEDVAAHTAEAC